MRAHLHHPANNKIEKLPENIPEPSLLVYPIHRIKVMCKEVFKLSLSSIKSLDCKLIDVLLDYDMIVEYIPNFKY